MKSNSKPVCKRGNDLSIPRSSAPWPAARRLFLALALASVGGHALAVFDQQTIAGFVRRFVQLRLKIDTGQLGEHASQELLNSGMVAGRAGHHFDPRRKAPPQAGATRGILRACESGGSHFQESFFARSVRSDTHRSPAAAADLTTRARILLTANLDCLARKVQ